MARLFVYGSLKRGFSNHARLRGGIFVRIARTAPRYSLRRHAGYPGLAEGSHAVEGELYDVDEALLRDLDDFEGPAYSRERIELEAFEGEEGREGQGAEEAAEAYVLVVSEAVPHHSPEWRLEDELR